MMTENSKRGRGQKDRTVENLVFWFTQVNAFLKVLNRRESASSAAIEDQESAFVQCFDAVGTKDFSTDAVGEALGCIRFMWACGDLVGNLFPKMFQFVPSRLYRRNSSFRGIRSRTTEIK